MVSLDKALWVIGVDVEGVEVGADALDRCKVLQCTHRSLVVEVVLILLQASVL